MVRQIIAGLLIVAAMFAIASVTLGRTAEQPVQESQEYCDAFNMF